MKSTRSPSWINSLRGAGTSLLGAGALRVPPHVFEVSESVLRYARFERSQGVLETTGYQEIALPRDLFHEGPMGGPIRETETFGRLLDELLSSCGAGVEHASVVLPDRWLRTILIDMEGADAIRSQDEFLRWRLKKMVPFRVEDLRIRGVSDGIGREETAKKTLVGFAVDQLLGDLEGAFSERGVRVGLITNRSLPMAGAVTAMPELRCVAMLTEDGYSLVFILAGRVALIRYKSLDPIRLGNGVEAAVRRDLRITRGYLQNELPAHGLSRGLVCGPEGSEEKWSALLEECLGVPSIKLGDGDLRPAMSSGKPWHVLAPLLGVAETEVA